MQRPKLILNIAATVDGRISLGKNRLLFEEMETWLSLAGPSLRQLHDTIHTLYQPQVILEGSGTFVAHDAPPQPLPPIEADPGVLFGDYLPTEVLDRPHHQGWYAIVDSRGRCRWKDKERGGWHLLLLVSWRTPAAYLAYLQGLKIPYLMAGRDHVDLAQAMQILRARLGVTCVISQAGGGLNGAPLRAGLVDEINLVTIPALVGGGETPSLMEAPELEPGESPICLEFISAQAQKDGNLWLRYHIKRPDEEPKLEKPEEDA